MSGQKPTLLRRLVGNTLAGFGGTVLQKALTFATTLILARGLGDEKFGIYSYVVAYMFFFGFVSDLGMERVVTREVGRAPQRAGQLMGSAVLLKLGLSLAALIAAVAVAEVLQISAPVRYCILVAALGLPLSIELVFRGYLQTRYEVKYGFAATVPGTVAFLLAALVCVRLGLPVYALFYAALAVGLATVAGLVVILRWRADLRLALGIRWWEMMGLLRDAAEVGLFGFLFLLSMRVDQLMLFHLRSATDVGLYATAVRLSEALSIVPEALLLTIFPLLVNTQASSPEQFRHTYRLGFKYLGALIMPVALVLTVLRRQTLGAVFGAEYEGASSALAILAWNMFFGYTGAVYLNLFIAQARQGLLLAVSGLAVAVNVGLNFLWIPDYGPGGAAAATVVANLAGFLCWCAIPATRPYMLACLQEVRWCVLAAVVAAGSAAALRLHELPALVVIAVVYGGLLWLLGGVAWADVVLLRRLFASGSEDDRPDARPLGG